MKNFEPLDNANAAGKADPSTDETGDGRKIRCARLLWSVVGAIVVIGWAAMIAEAVTGGGR
jgi:hypothetical protein